MATAHNLSAPFQTISIERDYRDCITKFYRELPNELNGKVSQNEFEHTIDKINTWLEKAETIDGRNVLEECIGCLTFFTSYLWYKDKYTSSVEKISRFLQEQNDTVYYNKGISWVNPMNNGYLKNPANANQSLSPFSSTSLSSPPQSSVHTQPTININSSPGQLTSQTSDSHAGGAASPNISTEISEQSSAITTNNTNFTNNTTTITTGNPDTIININNNNPHTDFSSDDDDADDTDSDTF
ncbi:diacylglycerol kinase protein DgkA [Heterostelium album PN500]|uniref:Ras modification protein ERF4 n=1 Tax=Heterostelium pallidum (strain ATCC 26659 / Pp 5 / PN500) TaxID=670386 RepID=D3B402_HETP5|nr:diacylglycerol kinase protein DgkA [Heterostelium album PN500]EFA84050.1 diacylglycerol kinase protein DgkA [Heterostelium album PN500]|eukprot:XP_020436167.1 diacylglycerol kinase protein DgkA [Heterostelium album PN500]